GDGYAAFRMASNLKTAWLGSTCQGVGVSASAIRTYSISVTLMRIFKFISRETCYTKKVTFHVYFYYVKFYCGRSKGKIKPIWVYFGHIQLVYSSFAYSNSFSKKLVIQKKLLFMGTFIVKVHLDWRTGKKIHFWCVLLPDIVSTHLRLMRIKHISSTRIS